MIKAEYITNKANKLFECLMNYATISIKDDFTYDHSVVPLLTIDNSDDYGVIIKVDYKFINMNNKSDIKDFRNKVLEFANNLVYYVGAIGLNSLIDFIFDTNKFVIKIFMNEKYGIKYDFVEFIKVSSLVEHDF